MNIDILAISAHPDDVELSCAGTILKHIHAGRTAAIVDLTRGELGTRGNGALRMEEATASAKVLGLTARENLGLPDGLFQRSDETLYKIVSVIRKYRPKIILANAPGDRHPDHGRAAKIVNDAVFLSGLIKFETTQAGEVQEPWRPDSLYHYIQDNYIKPDFVVDVTDYMDKKMEAVLSFKSQFYNPDSDEPETPISSLEFLEFLKARAREFGRPIGAKYGEGFVAARTVGVRDLFDLV